MIDSKFLEFEKPIAEIEARLEELKYIDDSKENIKRERMRLLKENKAITENIYKKLSDWQVAQISRHPMRQIMFRIFLKILLSFTVIECFPMILLLLEGLVD